MGLTVKAVGLIVQARVHPEGRYFCDRLDCSCSSRSLIPGREGEPPPPPTVSLKTAIIVVCRPGGWRHPQRPGPCETPYLGWPITALLTAENLTQASSAPEARKPSLEKQSLLITSLCKAWRKTTPCFSKFHR